MYAKSGEMISGRRRQRRFQPKLNYCFLAYWQWSVKFVCKFFSLLFVLGWQINKQINEKAISLLCAGNNVFLKIQAQEGWAVNPNPTLRTPLQGGKFTETQIATNVNFYKSFQTVSVC